MKKVNRRGFFEWLSRPAREDGAARPRDGHAKQQKAAPGVEAPSSTEFSMAAFYATRGPQKLPPIVIRPGVLHHAADTTRVGLAPAHEEPDLDDDPLYTELSKRTPEDS